MSRRVLLIKDITPTTPRPWTVKVTVTEKGTPRNAHNSPVKYQRLVLTDSVGGQVQLGIFDAQIGSFKDRLKLFKQYYISNTNVTEPKPDYQFGTTPYQWSLHNACVIDEVLDDSEGGAACTYNFVKVDNYVDFKDSPSTIDILVVVLQMLPRKKIKKPILACMRVKVVPYDGLSINSRNNSSFLLNPTIPEALVLRTWLFDNMSSVNELMNAENFVAKARAFGKEATNVVTTVHHAVTVTHLRLFNVKAHLKLVDYGQTFLFMSCGGCRGPTTAQQDAIYTCNYCGHPNMISVPRLKVDLIVADDTATVAATLSGLDAEQFLGITVGLFQENAESPVPKPLSSIVTSESDGPVLVQLRVYYTEYSGVKARKYNEILLPDEELNSIEVHQQPVAPARSLITDRVELQRQEISPMPQVKGGSAGIGAYTPASTFPDTRIFVETSDPDLSPEEKQLLQQILEKQLAKKQKINLSLTEHPPSDNLSILGDCCAVVTTTKKDTAATSEKTMRLGDDKEDETDKRLKESQVVVSKSAGKKPIDSFVVEPGNDLLIETDFIQDLLVGKEDQDFGVDRCASTKAAKIVTKSGAFAASDKVHTTRAKRKLVMTPVDES